MIIKKITNPKKSAAKHVRINALLDYITQDKKCLFFNTRHFLSQSFVANKREMIALAMEAVKSKDTIIHLVLSWKVHELPAREQLEQAVSIVLAQLELIEHQAVYALHQDTANRHLHLVVNRVHPTSTKLVKLNFELETLHQAIAKIEHQQGWQPETRARYRVTADGTLSRNGMTQTVVATASHPHWQQYSNARAAYYSAKHAMQQKLHMKHTAQKFALNAMQKNDRETFFASYDWHGHRAELNYLRSFYAAEQLKEKHNLRRQQKTETGVVMQPFAGGFPRFVDWQQPHAPDPEICQQAITPASAPKAPELTLPVVIENSHLIEIEGNASNFLVPVSLQLIESSDDFDHFHPK